MPPNHFLKLSCDHLRCFFPTHSLEAAASLPIYFHVRAEHSSFTVHALGITHASGTEKALRNRVFGTSSCRYDPVLFDNHINEATVWTVSMTNCFDFFQKASPTRISFPVWFWSNTIWWSSSFKDVLFPILLILTTVPQSVQFDWFVRKNCWDKTLPFLSLTNLL